MQKTYKLTKWQSTQKETQYIIMDDKDNIHGVLTIKGYKNTNLKKITIKQ